MPNLLLELGCEELPASTVEKSCEDLSVLVQKGLFEAKLTFGEVKKWGTPRRIILSIEGIQARQEDKTTALRGPAIKSAFDESENPTKALEGFCRGHGADPLSTRKEGDYIWIDKQVAGRGANEILQEILPEAINSMTFDKTMRWGNRRIRFVRPLRWMVALLDGAVIDIEIADVRSGQNSRGHRFDHPEEFAVSSLEGLLHGLRQRHVEPDAAIREANIREGAQQVADGVPDLSEALVDENVYLTEWPTAQQGSFAEKYLDLPEPVLVTAMAKHQRFFPVRSNEGKLTNKFVSIRNSGEEALVVAGNEWVLNARFNDAQFFYEEDQKRKLDDFLADTERMLFQEKLGSVRERADRLSRLAAQIATRSGGTSEEVEFAQKAGLYAKADLSTGLVNELSSLQGVIGGVYAQREGFPEAVCHAIATHYDLSKNDGQWCAASRTGVRLLMADQLDKLAGYLGLGLIPKGSSDPIGLRRATTLLVEAIWWWQGTFPHLDDLFADALAGYKKEFGLDVDLAQSALADILRGRYEALIPDARHDVLQAAFLDETLASVGSPRVISQRLNALEILAGDRAFVQTVIRPLNILSAARKKNETGGARFAPQEMNAEGQALATAISKTSILDLVENGSSDAVADAVRALAKPINLFFDSTMVMDQDLKIRALNLGLLAKVEVELLAVGDFSKIVIEG